MSEQAFTPDNQTASWFELPAKNEIVQTLAALRLEDKETMLHQLVDALYDAKASLTMEQVVRTVRAWQVHVFVTTRPGYKPPESLAGSQWETLDDAEVARIITVRTNPGS